MQKQRDPSLTGKRLQGSWYRRDRESESKAGKDTQDIDSLHREGGDRTHQDKHARGTDTHTCATSIITHTFRGTHTVYKFYIYTPHIRSIYNISRTGQKEILKTEVTRHLSVTRPGRIPKRSVGVVSNKSERSNKYGRAQPTNQTLERNQTRPDPKTIGRSGEQQE